MTSDRDGRHRALDASSLADATREACDRHASDRRVDGLEVYRRVSVGVRVERGHAAAGVEVGREDGCAVRLRAAGAAAIHAAAATADEAAVGCCIEEALRTDGVARHDEEWSPRHAARLTDLDVDPRLPSPEEVEAMLDRATLAATAAGVQRVVRASVRVARTIECCANDAGLTATRERIRTWAMLDLAPAPGLDTSTPVVAASRGLPGRGAGDWAERLAARRFPEGDPLRLAPGPRAVVLAPAPAAVVAGLIVRMNHAPGAAAGPATGFVAIDDPLVPDALFGGHFDDAGFEARAVDLTTGGLPSVGRLRRASFRDWPIPSSFNLIVRPPQRELPANRLWVTSLDVRRLDGAEVALILRGTVVEGGVPVAPFRDAVVRTTSHELEARCVGGAGVSVASHLGVSTPALVFDGLEVLSQ